MRKKNLLTAVLSLFLLVPASIIWAQTVSTQKGLTTIVFSNNANTIKVYLPDDLRPGDMISGTVIAEPSGNNARQKEKDITDLIAHSVNIGGNKFAITSHLSTFNYQLSKDRQKPISIELLNRNGTKITGLAFQAIEADNKVPEKSGCIIPLYALIADPVTVRGNFDGNAENTQCSLSGKPLEIFAESPRQCIVKYPSGLEGVQTMKINENGIEKCNSKISGVDLQVSAGKLNIRRGEKTFIDIKISGLGDIADKFVLTVSNQTPGVVRLSRGDLQTFIIYPAENNAPGGNFSVRCQAEGISNGSFLVNVDLDMPDVQADIKPLSQPRYLEKEAILFGLSKAWKDAYTDMIGSGTKNELEGCEPCANCIQSTVDEVKVNLIEKLGTGILETFTSKGIGLVGGWLEKAKKWYDKGMDAKGIIEELIKMGNLQVVVFEEKMCGYCLFSGIIFYETGTGCVDATFWCKGGPLCCNHANTMVIIQYCTDDRGYAIGKPNVTIKKM